MNSYSRIAPKPQAPGSRGPSASNSTQEPSSSTGQLRRIPYACTACKKAKTKCSGLPAPCQRCLKFGGDCVFDEATDQRRRVAAKRTAKDLKHQQDLWNQLLLTIGESDSDELLQLQSLIRHGAEVDEIETFIQNKLQVLEARGLGEEPTSVDLRDAEAEVTRVKESESSESPLEPDSKRRHTFMNGNTTNKGPDRTPPDKAVSRSASNNHRRRPSDIMAVSNLCDVPPLRVPIDNWTGLADHDTDFVSHLISLYFTWLNPFWRVIDEGTFLEAMRSPEQSSPSYCSRLLVNAVLAVSSHFSSHEAVYADRKNPMSRGARFHQEAIALWKREENKASLLNLQALCILALDSTIRGKDKLGWSLLDDVKKMYYELGLDKDPSLTQAASGQEREQYIKVRRFASWSIFNMISLFSLVMLRPANLEIPETSRPYDETSKSPITSWVQYPGTHPPRRVNQDFAFDALCSLMEIGWSVSRLLFAESPALPPEEMQAAVNEIMDRLQTWDEKLPDSLRYHQEATPLIFELQVCKCYVQTTLYSFFHKKATKIPEEQIDSKVASHLRQQTIASVRESADYIRHYREEFSFERVTLHMTASCFLGCCVLLDDIDDPRCAADFVDLFQCLFAGGHRIFLARALAQMVLLTAQRMSKHVPQQVFDMFTLAAQVDHTNQDSLDSLQESAMQSSWRPEESQYLSSFYPNYSVAKGSGNHDLEDMGLEELMKKWDGMGLGSDTEQ